MRPRPPLDRRRAPAARAAVAPAVLALALALAACGGPAAAPGSAAPSTTTTTRPSHDPETSAALLRIARTFNDDYAHNRDAAVYARWDAASRAIISGRDYVSRHRHCPAPGGNPKTWGVTQGTTGAWLVHYSIGGVQFTDYWYYVHGRFEFDLPKSNPSAVALYRLPAAQYAKRVGCGR